MSEEDPHEESFEAKLRRLAEQIGDSVENLSDLDVDQIAESLGVDLDRAKEFADQAGRWLHEQAETLAGEASVWLGNLGITVPQRDAAPGKGPHPLDLPTAAQGLALSALDSGRWTAQPGSHVLQSHEGDPPPADAAGIVGELRARDWINADGELTLVGRNALKRWLESAESA